MPDPPSSSRSSLPRDGPPHPSVDAMVAKAPLSSQESKGIILDSRARRRLALWDNPRLRLGRRTQFLVILGAPQGEDPAAPLLGSTPPAAAAPARALRAPGTGAAAPRPPSSGRQGEEALAPGLRSPAPSPRRGVRERVCVCACARGGGDFTSARCWLRLDWKVLALEPWICSLSLSILGTG